jgi:hypothetical protein
MDAFFHDLGEAVFVGGITLVLILLAGHAGIWRHRWRMRRDAIYRDDHEHHDQIEALRRQWQAAVDCGEYRKDFTMYLYERAGTGG